VPPHIVRPASRPPQLILAPPTNLQAPLWRSIAAFRFASLAYAAILLALRPSFYSHWAWAWAVLAGMTIWTVVTTFLYPSVSRSSARARRPWVLLSADLVVTVAALMSTDLLQYSTYIRDGAMPVTATWLAGPALAWAVVAGVRAGAISAIIIGGCVVLLRRIQPSDILQSTDLDGPVILLMAAMVAGYVSKLISSAEQAVARATELEASSRERERLARTIHDSVLQVLAMVQRRGAEAGGEAAELGRLAGEQEAALRVLITADDQAPPPAGELDLSAELALEPRPFVSVITPATPVLLNEMAVWETAAAVREALDNVRRHCGEDTKAWVLIDDEGSEVSVTIRDDGPGMPPKRLAEAAAEGRLGISHAIAGRMRDIGGSADISSTPGVGTEVRLRVPRPRTPGGPRTPGAPRAPRGGQVA
jgi:signal transduction histidine kinase